MTINPPSSHSHPSARPQTAPPRRCCPGPVVWFRLAAKKVWAWPPFSGLGFWAWPHLTAQQHPQSTRSHSPHTLGAWTACAACAACPPCPPAAWQLPAHCSPQPTSSCQVPFQSFPFPISLHRFLPPPSLDAAHPQAPAVCKQAVDLFFLPPVRLLCGRPVVSLEYIHSSCVFFSLFCSLSAHAHGSPLSRCHRPAPTNSRHHHRPSSHRPIPNTIRRPFDHHSCFEEEELRRKEEEALDCLDDRHNFTLSARGPVDCSTLRTPPRSCDERETGTPLVDHAPCLFLVPPTRQSRLPSPQTRCRRNKTHATAAQTARSQVHHEPRLRTAYLHRLI